MTWDFLITKIENGFLLTYTSDENEEVIIEEAVVEKETNDKGKWMSEEETRANIAHDLCWHIIEYFCLGGSKYDSHRARVTIEPGHCHESFVETDGEE